MVSIIVPVWGTYKKYLPACLDSIKKQTYKNYEVIVVSNKRSLPSARNEGIRRAKGEWILPLDVDDTLHPEYLEKTIGKGDIITTASNQNGKKYLPAEKITLQGMKETNIVIACSLFKKEVWKKVGGYDETMKTGLEDWDFWLRAMIKGYKIEVVDEMLYNYNKRPDGQISTMKNKVEAIAHLRSKHFKYSVIIPTMWASDKILKMIKVYDKCPYIQEVLLINNKPEDSLKLKSKKLKVIYKGKNIYVNPAWNLGVKKAKSENVIIANDDIYFENLNELLNIIIPDKNILIGPALTSYKKQDKGNGRYDDIPPYQGRIRLQEVNTMNWGYGTFMIMDKKSYKQVPKHLLIWEGDLIQFHNNKSFVFQGINIETEMSETIKKFDLQGKADEDVKDKRLSRTKLVVQKQDTDRLVKKVDFIITTFNRYDCLDVLLKSIKNFYPKASVIIADNGEYNNMFYARWKEKLDIKPLRLDYDSGLSYCRNKAVQKSDKDYIVLLDDDFIFTEETKLEKFYKVMLSDRKIGVVGGMCLENGVEVHYECNLRLKDGVFEQLPDGNKWTDINGVKAKPTQCVLNFGLFRKEMLETWKWDNDLILSEHSDFFLRLSKSDWKVIYTPEVKILHTRTRTDDYKKFRDRGIEYKKVFFKKHGINKMIGLNGNVSELIGDSFKNYKIFK